MTAREVAARLRGLAREGFQRAVGAVDRTDDLTPGVVRGNLRAAVQAAQTALELADDVEHLGRAFRVWEEG